MTIMSWQKDTQAPHLNNIQDALKEYCATNPLDYTMLATLIVQYVVTFLEIKEYIAQSFPTYAIFIILLHKQIYCAIILRI